MRALRSPLAFGALVLAMAVTVTSSCDDGAGSEDAGPDAAWSGPTFECSELECRLGLDYCYVETPTTAGTEGTIECRVLPAACEGQGDPSCECVSPGPGFACACVEDPEDAIMLQCSR